MENFISAYYSSHKTRDFKKKNLHYRDLLQRGFSFQYAGVCDVFITYQNLKYVIVCSGFTYDGINIFFGKNRTCRRSFDSLYVCILAFHQVVRAITSSIDWFTPDFFNQLEFYNYANEDIYK